MDAPRKFRIPDGTTIPPWGYVTDDEHDFHLPPPATDSFLLSSTGDDVWLTSGDAAGQLTGYAVGRDFGAAQNGISFGLHVNSVGDEFFVAQSNNTLGAQNSPPLVGPVVVSEIMYHPPDAGTNDNTALEYIELLNAGAVAAPLFNTAAPSNAWRIRNAVDYDFPTGVVLAAGQRIVIVGFDPADTNLAPAFRTAYGLPVNAPLFGPWSGKLDNSDERIELRRPDNPNTNMVPYILVESVHYRDNLPWDSGADGTGMSLHRIAPTRFGDDPLYWAAMPPTPGTDPDWSRDQDADRVPDWMEWLAGTDRGDSNSVLRMLSAETSGTNLTIRWNAVSNRTFIVERSTNLLLQGYTPYLDAVTGSGASFAASGTNAADAAFYRIRLKLP